MTGRRPVTAVFARAAVLSVLLLVALTGCSATAISAQLVAKTVQVNGKTVTCVVAGGGSGTPALSCDWAGAR